MAGYDVNGKVALVTGAGSGMCLSLTQELLKAGCSVMIGDLTLRPEAEATAAQHPHPPRKAGNPSVAFHKTDVTDWSQLTSLWETALKTFGRVDILVNGAGIFEPPWTAFWNPPGVSPEAKDPADASVGAYQIFSVNTIAPIRLAQIAIDYWLQNREVKGNLLWVSSVGGYLHSIQTPLYFASKAAILSVAKSLQGLKQLVGIRNSVICPGPARTPLFDQEFCRDRLGQDDLALSSEDLAVVMMQLLTEAKYGNGTVLEVLMAGSKEGPKIHQREVQLEALYPTVNPLEGGSKVMEEERKFMGLIAEKGMRSTC
ncbi:NAD(P)-binding protein [Sodiomyces alkalinus F11]|uniref:NAD(P)-binding protein n=1 Tax=Sodiomyces alkalinus (strain CBS 110278 / VKM F-3762 / F11) TaxID=1314773 RepID=A0A3N2PNX7_SODAK|nr:NAD(P)-binding protein [Sodiomyces alkalinus F11]ROT36140.1 NAD(P)-binding protein [Sodiomyces alkalinus F11]